MKPPKPPAPPDETATLDDPAGPSAEAVGAPGPPDLSGLTVAGITRRRLGFLGGALVSAWIVIIFARQVGEASAATARVDGLRAANETLTAHLAALERESVLIQRQEWVVQQAHSYRLGTSGEIPFTLGPAPELPADAPGSASLRLGGEHDAPTPLESWLSLLFGPSR